MLNKHLFSHSLNLNLSYLLYDNHSLLLHLISFPLLLYLIILSLLLHLIFLSPPLPYHSLSYSTLSFLSFSTLSFPLLLYLIFPSPPPPFILSPPPYHSLSYSTLSFSLLHLIILSPPLPYLSFNFANYNDDHNTFYIVILTSFPSHLLPLSLPSPLASFPYHFLPLCLLFYISPPWTLCERCREDRSTSHCSGMW